MKKWIGLIVLLLILGACSNAGGKGKETKTNEEPDTEVASNTNKDHEAEKADESKEANKDSEDQQAENKDSEKKTPEPEYQINENWFFKPIDDANPKVALLTFDDAPDEHAVQMAETLKKFNAPAIFFVNGHFINTPEGKEKLKKIHEMGFMIGNHTETHSSLPSLTKEEQKKEIVALNDKIEKIIGERPKFFRAPFGENTDYSKKLAAEENMLIMNWTYGYDWNKEYMDADKIADIMVNTPLLANGSNLLMHDRDWTAKALPRIIKGLRNKGYELLDPHLIKTP
ncbi:polysaccharide deacetylase family protein [Halobacillus salinarum]|uniref:Polysaccharide deacetylase family protein n=1 Tax=Halobacillus salinarum TaxID=2932257 RepID=A0ABY4EGJ4_9BACI|nr:polysaccharide deacetylase family protein [Halobacillus salinarum]UOQ43183.1 polysaccharide deacetylase family protein [Halobacillus salinarum]